MKESSVRSQLQPQGPRAAVLGPVELGEAPVIERIEFEVELDAALLQADDAIGHHRQQRRVVDHRDQRGAERRARQQAADLGGGQRVEARRRFIGEDQPRPLHQHARDRDLLALAAREPVGALIGLGEQAHVAQRGLGLAQLRRGVAAHPTAPAAAASEPADEHVLDRRQPLHQMQPLQHLADLRAQRPQLAAPSARVAPEHTNFTSQRQHEAAERAQQGRLAGAVGPDQRDTFAGQHLPFVDVERDAFGRSAHQPLHRDDGLVHHSSAARMRRLAASKTNTSAITTSRIVARRPHWNSAVASEISKPRPPAPMSPRMVESRMLYSQM